jgi:hypothetical protein
VKKRRHKLDEPYEPPRCCHIPENKTPDDPSGHCRQKPSIKITDGVETAYACGDHAAEVREDSYAVNMNSGKPIP